MYFPYTSSLGWVLSYTIRVPSLKSSFLGGQREARPLSFTHLEVVVFLWARWPEALQTKDFSAQEVDLYEKWNQYGVKEVSKCQEMRWSPWWPASRPFLLLLQDLPWLLSTHGSWAFVQITECSLVPAYSPVWSFIHHWYKSKVDKWKERTPIASCLSPHFWIKFGHLQHKWS